MASVPRIQETPVLSVVMETTHVFSKKTHVDGKEIDVSGILRLAYDIIF